MWMTKAGSSSSGWTSGTSEVPTGMAPGRGGVEQAVMPRPDADQPLLPSVLDRLIDLEPRVSSEPPAARPRVLAQIKSAVRRDLDGAFLVHQRAWRAVRDADRRPQRLLTTDPARVAAPRLAPRDVVPESLDRTRELERLRFEICNGGWCVELEPQKARS